ncbi:MAG: glucose dehydrogenase, partial [Candidatus Marinimicrobia bacterium]|nr:glucose dehydrogenase [Candidatus Neomarinimicrobiota bacterium]
LFSFIFSQLSLSIIGEDFDKPIYATSHPEHINIIYVVEQSGIIRIINQTNKEESIFLDIEDRVHQPLFPADERGLLGFAFDPDFKNNGFIYINYVNKKDYTRVSRLAADIYLANKDSEEILIEIKQPYSNHNGGFLDFGPDNYLYISVGDGGSSGDPDNNAQDLTNLFGTILRIDVSSDSGYSVPSSNPFLNQDDYMDEVWSYGLRNVWRFSFDRLTGDLYMGDVGQNNWEEINFQSYDSNGGENYGWKIMEANHCFKSDQCDTTNLILPIFEYPNDANYVKTILGIRQKNMHGCSITGGYVYRGEKIPELYGKYVFGDYCTGKIWSFKYDDNQLTNLEDHSKNILNSINKKEFYLSSFGELANGEILLVDYVGDIYLLEKK